MCVRVFVSYVCEIVIADGDVLTWLLQKLCPTVTWGGKGWQRCSTANRSMVSRAACLNGWHGGWVQIIESSLLCTKHIHPYTHVIHVHIHMPTVDRVRVHTNIHIHTYTHPHIHTYTHADIIG